MTYVLVITLLNEEKTIEELLSALQRQTKIPEEIIFVDGGSTDRTTQILRQINKNEFTSMIQIIEEESVSIARGRNIGIKNASGDVIVMTDGGCIPHRDWFEKITQPLSDPKADVVAGFYQMTGDSTLQKCLACYLGILPQKLNPDNFLPSARSMAFRKDIWQKVGGFSEKLERGGEDTLFNYQAKKMGAKFFTAKDALVDWQLPKTWGEAIKKFYVYAKGDGQAGIWWHPNQRLSTHNLKITSIYSRYLVFLILLMMGFNWSGSWWVLFASLVAYLTWATFKNYQFVGGAEAVFYLPAIQVISDLAVMAGFLRGSFSKTV